MEEIVKPVEAIRRQRNDMEDRIKAAVGEITKEFMDSTGLMIVKLEIEFAQFTKTSGEMYMHPSRVRVQAEQV